MISACERVFGGRSRPDVLALLARSGYDGIDVIGEPDRAGAARLGEDARGGLAVDVQKARTRCGG
ncbi:MAG: hypothetical protein M3312_08625 [Actinomycetota bacterium]|nr:hypothetical protein [Actinomycetota bacterium]